MIIDTNQLHSADFVYEHLLCEFSHWDFCLIGLVEVDGRKMLCRVRDDVDDDSDPPAYTLHGIRWDSTCDEFIDDYRVAYKHWFYEKGQRPVAYGGWPISWFDEKWGTTNPIVERTDA